MMKSKYDNYLNIAFEGEGLSKQKIVQFEKNYTCFFPAEKDAAILDIGPGKGEMLSCLKNYGFSNTEAVDISESVVEHINKLGFKISLSTDLASFLSKRKKAFSLITMCDVVEHIPREQILDVLSAVHDSLEDTGVMIVQVPNMQSITANIFRYDDFTHEAGYTERSLKQILALSGFSSVQCFGFEFLTNSVKSKIHYLLRAIFWFFTKLGRKINGTMPHKIMHPVFFAIARK